MEIDSSTLMHYLNLQKLAKERFELRLNYLHWLSRNYLLKYTQSSLRSVSEFGTSSIRRIFYGSENIFFMGLKIWDVVSVEFKEVCPLSLFKKVIKMTVWCQAVHIDLRYSKNPSFHRSYMKSYCLCLGARNKKLTYGNGVNVDRPTFFFFFFWFSLGGHKLCFRQSHMTITSIYLKSFVSYLLIL